MKKVIILVTLLSVVFSGIGEAVNCNILYEKTKKEMTGKVTLKDYKFERMRPIWDFLIKEEIHPMVVAGIMGNIWIESDFNSTITSRSGYYGYVQMSRSLQRLVRNKYKSLSADSQLLHISKWVKGKETGDLAYMQDVFCKCNITSPEQAAKNFAKYYERPKSKNYQNRMQKARLIYDYFIIDKK